MQAIENKKRIDRIQASDLKNVVLKKTNQQEIHKNKKKKGNYMPSLDEIRVALQSLQKIN